MLTRMPTRICVLLVGCMMVASAVPSVFSPGHAGEVRVIIGFKQGIDAPAATAEGGRVVRLLPLVKAMAAYVREDRLDRLRSRPGVAYVEPDAPVHALQGEVLPWGVDRIDAEKVHPYGKGAGVKVAVIDTGIDYSHPDLADNYKGGVDYVQNDGDPMDDNGHGTHCAGIIAAVDNDIGVIGVAPGAYLYAVKVLDSTGSGYVSDVVAGIGWAVDNGIQIISMSLGSNYDSTTLRYACDAAYKAGILLVAAAGNDYRAGRDTVDYPARYDSVIAVGATDENDVKASWSSTGSALELAAPGVSILSTYPGETYAKMSGTSMACPHVAGTLALVWHNEPELENSQVRERLQQTADDLGSLGKDSWYGYGLVDADEAALGPSQPVTKTYAPEGVTVKKGAVSGGELTSLQADDGDYLAVTSARSGFRQVVDWYSYVKISESRSQVTGLTIAYNGKYSATRTQTLYVYNFASRTWVKIDSREVGESDATIVWSTPSPSAYVSSDGEIRLRVYASGTTSFTCYADSVLYTVQST